VEAMDSAAASILAGDESLLSSFQRSPRERLFQSVVTDIDRAVLHFNTGVIDEGTLVGVLRDRLAALEQLAQVEVPS
jgi:hypothetical protein